MLYFEHKLLYRSTKDVIPDDYYTLPIGKARVVNEGSDLSIITYGMGVHWAQEVLAGMPGVSAEVIDLRSLLPWDRETVAESVKKNRPRARAARRHAGRRRWRRDKRLDNRALL